MNFKFVRDTYSSPWSLSEKQLASFEIIFQHCANGENDGALKMIILGTARVGKYSLVVCISHALSSATTNGKIPLLLLSPTRIVASNIRGKTIHSALKIAIKDMKHIQNVLNRLLQISAKIKNIPFSKMVKILISTSTK